MRARSQHTDRVRLLTRHQVAELFGISPWTVWSWRRRGWLPPPIPLGPVRLLRWREIDLEIYLDRIKSGSFRGPTVPPRVQRKYEGCRLNKRKTAA